MQKMQLSPTLTYKACAYSVSIIAYNSSGYIILTVYAGVVWQFQALYHIIQTNKARHFYKPQTCIEALPGYLF